MRLFFLLCVVVCTVAALSPPIAVDAGEGRATVAAARVFHRAIPVTLVLNFTTSTATAGNDPTPDPTPKITEEPVRTDPPPAPPTEQPTAEPATPTPAPTQSPDPTPTPAPAPTAKPSPPSGSQSRQQVAAAIRATWPGDDDEAVSVASCESGLNPEATSPGGVNLGLWQFRMETWRAYGGSGDPRDHSAAEQTEVAWRLFSARGWGPWGGCA